jgi:hypothetical protein
MYYAILAWEKIKDKIDMAEITVKALLFWAIYSPLYLLGIFTLDDVKQITLLVFLIITGSIRFFRWMVRDSQRKKLIDIEIRERELGIEKKEKEADKIKKK